MSNVSKQGQIVSKIKPCQCGKQPGGLYIARQHSRSDYSHVRAGDCCGSWEIEFRTGLHPLYSAKTMDAAVDAWNGAVRNQL